MEPTDFCQAAIASLTTSNKPPILIVKFVRISVWIVQQPILTAINVREPTETAQPFRNVFAIVDILIQEYRIVLNVLIGAKHALTQAIIVCLVLALKGMSHKQHSANVKTDTLKTVQQQTVFNVITNVILANLHLWTVLRAQAIELIRLLVSVQLVRQKPNYFIYGFGSIFFKFVRY